ncbi:GntR family transcriptional regulator [Bacillus sp. 03113]|uniref:GntR family transcriptional regulator n=1 Tax=Bacillus sp. 03113 TaxID=2578211 RepID=UPI0011419F68|nr:GntR family transcriptional regulator [Bacillus sp. 03113]
MEIPKIDKPDSYKLLAYKQIKKAIIHHSMKGGEIISERDLSATLGISRTPIREATLQLEMEGWLEILPRKGILVKSIKEKDVEEIMQLRKALECLVIDLLMPIISEKTIKKIEEIFLPQPNQTEEEILAVNTGGDIHLHLAELTENKRLINWINILSEQILWLGTKAIVIPGRLEEVIAEHANIIQAFKNRDKEEAYKRTIEHLEKTRNAILSNFND